MAPSSRLRASALEWVPSQQSQQLLQSIAGRNAPGTAAAAATVEEQGDDVEQKVFSAENFLASAPKEVVACILAHLGSTEDLCSAIAACRALRAAAADAAFAVCVSPAQRRALGDPSRQPMLQIMAEWAAKYCPSSVALDMSGVPLEDALLSSLLACMPRLARLDLEGCRKLTPAATRLLLARAGLTAAASDASASSSASGEEQEGPQQQQQRECQNVACGLRWINMQRCFQFKGCCLDDLLTLARAPGSRLEGCAVSHLTLEGAGCACDGDGNRCGRGVGAPCSGNAASSDAPAGGSSAAPLLAQQPQAPPPQRPLRSDACCSLRVAALTNCTLTPTALLALAGAAPRLEYLFLGGSTLRLEHDPVALAQLAAAAAAAAATAEAGGGQLGPAVAAGAVVGSPPQAGAGVAAAATAASCGSSSGASAPACRAALEARLARPAPRPPTTLDAGCGPSAAVARARGLALAAAALALPRLRVVEATFFGAPALEWLRLALALARTPRAATGAAAADGGSGGCEVWDLCEPACVHRAVLELTAAARRGGSNGSSSSSSGGGIAAARGGVSPAPGASSSNNNSTSAAVDAALLARALRAAANCSSHNRTTALHVAAEAGRAAAVRALAFGLGAGVAARDAHGAQPLFMACEAGHADAAAALLRAGACATAPTTGGETPLYIAALKGHRAVVQLLLRHLAGVPWHSASLYGDGFTPLMAAAVANHVDVATLLLQEAGRNARALARATNRYGHSALSIAARKNCAAMMALLATAAA